MSSARLSTRPEIKITIALGPSEGAVIASIRRARAALERRLAEYWKSLPMREVP